MEQATVERLHRFIDGLNVAQTEEATDRAFGEFVAELDEDVKQILGREAMADVGSMIRAAFDGGYSIGLRRSAQLMERAMLDEEQAA